MPTNHAHIHRDGRIFIRVASLATTMEIYQIDTLRHMVPIRLERTMVITAIDTIPFGSYGSRIRGIVQRILVGRRAGGRGLDDTSSSTSLRCGGRGQMRDSGSGRLCMGGRGDSGNYLRCSGRIRRVRWRQRRRGSGTSRRSLSRMSSRRIALLKWVCNKIDARYQDQK